MSNHHPPIIKVSKSKTGEWLARLGDFWASGETALMSIQNLKKYWIQSGNLDATFPSCHEIIDPPKEEEQNTA